jgi:uncharacterized protein YozE (UPF0346 family)
MATFNDWLKVAKPRTNPQLADPVGDFVLDARDDPTFPNVTSSAQLSRYLFSQGACRECREIVPDIWRRFQNWKHKNHPR